MDLSRFIEEALTLPRPALAYIVGRRLESLFPDRYVLETTGHAFDLFRYARHGLCRVTAREQPAPQWETTWMSLEDGLHRSPPNVWLSVEWREERMDVLLLHWTGEDGCPTQRWWILARSREVAEEFLSEVSAWCSEVRGEILVFAGGGWSRSGKLFESIRNARFGNLVLRGDLKERIYQDLRSFFDSRETYERYGIPWKRGVLLIGPPGNGKTHAVKAIINALERPCLYVQSFKHPYRTDHDMMREVFDFARKTAPCLLVLEDLDSLVNETNRSFFLNELDGFAANTGVVTLATTNHPERLDPAILDRPSRFDRKYYFELPGLAERRDYVALWSAGLAEELRLSPNEVDAVARETEDFSFAYLKELFLSSMMAWVHNTEQWRLGRTLLAQAQPLREQMRAGHAAREPVREEPYDAEDDE